MGADTLAPHVREASSALNSGETTADGSVTVEQVFCLGNCALRPAACWMASRRRPMAPARRIDR